LLIHNNEELMKHIESQITKVEDSFEKLKESKKNHNDPAYKNMLKEDIKFFGQQTDELIKVDQDVLKIYKQRLDLLRKINK